MLELVLRSGLKLTTTSTKRIQAVVRNSNSISCSEGEEGNHKMIEPMFLATRYITGTIRTSVSLKAVPPMRIYDPGKVFIIAGIFTASVLQLVPAPLRNPAGIIIMPKVVLVGGYLANVLRS